MRPSRRGRSRPVSWVPAAAPAGRQASIVAARIASCVARSLARSGTALMDASTPTDGFAAISFIALSVARMNPATASCFAEIVAVEAMIPGPGSGVISSTREDGRLRPGELELDRLVVHEPGRRVHGAGRDGRPLAEVRVLDDRGVGGREVRGGEQRLEHDPRRAVLARDADLLALQVGGGVDPRRRLREHDRGELAVDRRDVLDRDPLADRRDDARPVGEPEVDLALPDLRDQVRVDLVLERDLQALRRVVAGLVGPVERRELDARDVAEPDGQADRLRGATDEAADE